MEYIANSIAFLKKNCWISASIFLGVLCLVGSITFVSLTRKKCMECEGCKECACDKENQTIKTLAVDIKGAVVHPGVYKLSDGAKVKDAIEDAGGFIAKASTKNINLSQSLKDEMVIYIFTEEELVKKKNVEKSVCDLPKCECQKDVVNICPSGNENRDEPIKKDDETPSEKEELKPGTDKIPDDSSQKDDEKDEEDSRPVERPPTDEQPEDKPDDESKKDEDSEPNEEHSPSEPIVSEENKLISINMASVEELMQVNGLGLSKAQAIVKYRKENGSFTTLEDIQKVKGIGKVLFEKIKDKISL